MHAHRGKGKSRSRSRKKKKGKKKKGRKRSKSRSKSRGKVADAIYLSCYIVLLCSVWYATAAHALWVAINSPHAL